MAYIRSEIHSLTDAIARHGREIALLCEYRTRLVADVVTGKLDVRAAAATLPDQAAPEVAGDEGDLSDEGDVPDEEDVA